MHNSLNRVIPVLLSLSLASCQTVINDPEPSLSFKVPDNWESTDSHQTMVTGWLDLFDDQQLNHYVRTALQNNFNLQINAQQLEAAIANAKAAHANLYPDLSLGVQRARRKSFVIDAQGDAVAQYSSDYQADLNISWEADLWGKLSDASRAAYLDSQVLLALYRSARLALAANVAQTWFNTLEAANQLKLSQQQLQSLSEALDIVENNYQAGLNSAVDVFTAKSDLQNQKSLVAQLTQNLEALKRSFNLLLGQYPTAQLDLENTLIPKLFEQIPAGLPSELLLRRPDINAARYNWLAQDYNRKATRKNRFPSFTLTGNLGTSGERFSRLLESDAIFWSLITGLSQPIFNAGRLKALEDAASSQTRQALAEYANTILNAYIEVENALAGERYLRTQYQTTRAAAQLAKSAYDISLEQYQSGLIDYVTVLTSQRQYFSADSRQISLYNELIQNRINLHLALGGDFFTPVDQ